MNEFSDAEVRALRVVLEEVRGSVPPPIDWEGLERRTLASIDAETHRASAANPSHSTGIGAVLAFVMAAAAVVILLTSQGAMTPRAATTGSPMEHGHHARTEGNSGGSSEDDSSPWFAPALAVGSRMVAGRDGSRFDWPGVATWELGPGAIGVMARDGGAPSVVLERGELQVRVTPHRAVGKTLETFVVEAAGARIAVHGTTFSVALDGERVLVDVTEGVVSVGPLGRRSSDADATVRGPGRAAFSSRDGALLEVMAVPPSSRRTSGLARGHADDTHARRGADTSAKPVAAEHSPPREDSRPEEAPTASHRAEFSAPGGAPSGEPVVAIEEKPMLFSALRGQLLSCLSVDRDVADPTLRIVASTEVRFRLDAERRVATVRFSPPVRADLQQRCAAPILGRVIEGGGTEPSVTVQFAPK